MQVYQFLSLCSPCEIHQFDDPEATEKIRWAKEGFDWGWHDNKNWWAYELTYDPEIVNDSPYNANVNDIIYGYGFESFTGKDEAEQWGREMEEDLEKMLEEQLKAANKNQ